MIFNIACHLPSFIGVFFICFSASFLVCTPRSSIKLKASTNRASTKNLRSLPLKLLLSLITLCNLFLTSTTNALDAQHVEHFVINGFDVYVINTHVGNKMAMTVNVEAGSAHDDPIQHAGRAHFFEHIIHGGSQKYSGHGTFLKEITKAGGRYNAYTAADQTFYHWSGHPNGFFEVVELMGAMHSAPDWDSTVFEMERSTVKAEAINKKSVDSTILSDGMAYHLMSAGHPMRKFSLGTTKQLDEMTIQDLQKLFYSNYVPGSMQLIVAGNFDSGNGSGQDIISKRRVLNALKRYFVPAHPNGQALEIRAKDKVIPSVIKGTSGRRSVAFGTKSDSRTLRLQFEHQEETNYAAKLLLYDYLNLDNEGSMIDQFLNKGWILSCGIGASDVNNLNTTLVQIELTEEGAKHRDEVIADFFSVIHNVVTASFPKNVLNFLQTKNIAGSMKSARDAETAATYLGSVITAKQPALEAFKFQEFYSSVTADQIRESAQRIFDPDQMLIGYMGPDIDTAQLDELFDRPFMKRVKGRR